MLAPASTQHASTPSRRSLRGCEEGSLNISSGLTIVGVIIGAVVTMAIVAALLPTFLNSLADVNTEFNDPNATTGDATADSLLTIFPILIALGGLFAIVGLILMAVRVRKGA